MIVCCAEAAAARIRELNTADLLLVKHMYLIFCIFSIIVIIVEHARHAISQMLLLLFFVGIDFIITFVVNVIVSLMLLSKNLFPFKPIYSCP